MAAIDSVGKHRGDDPELLSCEHRDRMVAGEPPDQGTCWTVIRENRAGSVAAAWMMAMTPDLYLLGAMGGDGNAQLRQPGSARSLFARLGSRRPDC
jgi:hypothetical protein